jgi:hypothetical protein
MDQALKPTSRWSSIVNLAIAKNSIDFGNVTPGGNIIDLFHWVTGKPVPGFADTEYDIVDLGWGEHQFIRKYTGAVSHEDVPLTLTHNAYEMFAFGASSIVAAVGGVNSMAGLSGVFSGGGVNLNTELPATTMFNNENTGHSAQFVHSYADIKSYWATLLQDIQ